MNELHRLSKALLRLHKALLDGERASYEPVHGRITSKGEFLHLLLGHPWFAWLRQLSNFIAAIDEITEAKEAAVHDSLSDLLSSLRALLTPSQESDGFGRRYYDAMQRDPDVVLAHAEVRGLLG